MLIFLIILHSVSGACCLNCISVVNKSCEECASPYLLSNGVCIIDCGYGYISNDTHCIQNSSSLTFISTNFGGIFDYLSSTAGDFQTNDGSPLLNSTNFLPEPGRGFYSNGNSTLVGNLPWIPNNMLTISLYFRPLQSDGTILQIIDSDMNNYVTIEMVEEYIQVQVSIISQIDQTIEVLTGSNTFLNQSQGVWFNLLLQISQNSTDKVLLSIGLPEGTSEFTAKDFELYLPGISQWLLGSLSPNSSLQCFYYQVTASNALSNCFLSISLSNFCDYSYYLSPSGACISCGDACDPRLTCVDGLICGQCYFVECSDCNGYLMGGCTACTNGEVAPVCCSAYCRTCDQVSLCAACQDNHFMYETVCLAVSPVGGLTAVEYPVASALFDAPFSGSYGVFTTGYSSSNYQFFESPEASDPIPAKQRGLYFSGNSVVIANIALPHVFSIGILLKPTDSANMTIVNDGNNIVVQAFGSVASVNAELDDGTYSIFRSDAIQAFGTWTFIALSLNYSFPTSTLCAYINGVQVFSNSFPGVYRTFSSSIAVGGGANSVSPGLLYYKGFLYSIYLWNTPITDFSAYLDFTVCTPEIAVDCMWDCDIDEYLVANGACSYCMDNCDLGCVKDQSCNVCQDQLCAVCLDFGNTCVACVANAQMISGICQCNTNTIVFPTWCELCDATCATCFIPYGNGCYTCANAGELVCEGVCVEQCPDGFEEAGGNCEGGDYVVLELRLCNVEEYGETQGVVVGSSGVGKDINDPHACPDRGYYFTINNGMLATDRMLFAIISIDFWIKISSDGKIIGKNTDLLIISAASGEVCVTASLVVEALSACAGHTGTWEYYSIQFDISSIGLTELSLFRNSVLLQSATSQTTRLLADSPSNIIIGNYNSNGFTGFLWSLSIFNAINVNITDYITLHCIGGCTQCPLEQLCPSACDFYSPADNCTDFCSSACMTCYSSQVCFECYDTATFLTNFTCACPQRFVWNSTQEMCIFPCLPNCTGCDQTTIGKCSECETGYYIVDDVCIRCPSGYVVEGSRCVFDHPVIFNITLVNTNGTVFDSASGNYVAAGESNRFYPNYDYNDPYLTLDRGYYFNGFSSIIVFNNLQLLLAPEFTFEIWFMPNCYNGILFSKQSSFELGPLVIFEISDGQMVVRLNQVPFGVSDFLLGLFTVTNEWNYFKFSIKSLENVNFEFISTLNNLTRLYSNTNKTYLSDSMDSSYAIIGAEAVLSRSRSLLSYSSFFQGFIYQIQMYNIAIEINSNVDCNEACDSCLPSHECLPSCEISEYWLEGTFSNCSKCSTDCEFGCKDNKTSCLLCDDILCSICPYISTCEECVSGASIAGNETECTCLENYINNGDSCSVCEGGYVQNNLCVPCNSNCMECTNITCIMCVPHANLVNQECYCELGYYGISTCDLVLFYVSASISAENIIYLDFSDALQDTLLASDITLVIDLTNPSFSLSQFTETRYAIYLEFNESIAQDTQISIILNKLLSVKNGILNCTEFTLELNAVTLSTDSPLRLALKSISETCASAASYAIISVNMLNSNPASLWSFINTVQMLIFIYLVKIQMSERFTGYLLGLRKYQTFPNIFDYINCYQGMPHQFAHAKELGYANNSIFYNIGNWVSCFLFFVTLYYVLYAWYWALSKTKYKNSKVANLILGKCQGYKYGFFLRFWIQAYLEISVACFIVYYSSELSQLTQAYNFYFAIIFGVIITQMIVGLTPIVSCIVGMKKLTEVKDLTQPKLNVWASLFYEFKEDSGAAQSHFYTIFFLRRIVFITILFVLQDYPVIQMSLCEILMLAVFIT